MVTFSSDVLNPLVRGHNLSRSTAEHALSEILAGRVEGLLIASFLTALTIKGETVEEMTGFIDAMMAAATKVPISKTVLDIVGTGGDQLHTANISTMASFALAGAGVTVAKHGNRAASSSVGAADVLEHLGYNLEIDGALVQQSLAESNFAFLFAPKYHHALGYLTPIRRGLGFRTIFNALGPLANPAAAQTMVLGVAQAQLMDKMAKVLQARGIQRAILVHGTDGLDELSLGGPSTLLHVTPDEIRPEELDGPKVFGTTDDARSIRGGDVSRNSEIFHSVLDGQDSSYARVVCANAALGFVAYGATASYREGFEMARSSLRDGRAKAALEAAIRISQLTS